MLEKRESKLKAVFLILAIGLFFYWRTGLSNKDSGKVEIVFPKNIYIESTDNQEVKDFLKKSPTLKESVDKALDYYNKEQFSDSAVIVERVVSENKGFRDGQYLLAKIYLELDKSGSAQKTESVKKIDETKSEMQFNYLDKAEIALKKAINIDPINGKLYQLLGEVMEKKGNTQLAGEYRKKAEELK